MPMSVLAAARDRVRLHPEWRRIGRYAWSVRFGVASAVFEGGRVVCDVLAADPPISRAWFSAIAGAFALAAVLSRFIAQSALSGETANG